MNAIFILFTFTAHPTKYAIDAAQKCKKHESKGCNLRKKWDTNKELRHNSLMTISTFIYLQKIK